MGYPQFIISCKKFIYMFMLYIYTVIEQISGTNNVLNHLSVPAACFTHPEISMVGLTEVCNSWCTYTFAAYIHSFTHICINTFTQLDTCMHIHSWYNTHIDITKYIHTVGYIHIYIYTYVVTYGYSIHTYIVDTIPSNWHIEFLSASSKD